MPLYLVVAALCWRNGQAMSAPVRPGPTAFFQARAQRRVWLALAFTLLLLGISSQVGLEVLITGLGRQAAWRQGWYGTRRGAQREVIALALFSAAIASAALFTLARRAGAWAMVAGLNTTALCAFLVVRMVSLHDLDTLLSHRWKSFTINRLVEIGAIAFNALAALAAWRRSHADRPSRAVTYRAVDRS